MVSRKKKLLGQLLIEKGIVTERQRDRALDLQRLEGGFIGEKLIKLGYLTEEDIINCLCNEYGFPYLPLSNYEIDPEVIKLLPGRVVRQYYAIPIDKIGNILTLAMLDPLNVVAIKDIEFLTGCKAEVFISKLDEVKGVMDKYYGPAELEGFEE